VLDSYVHKVYETVRQHGSQKGINVAIAERELLGIDHGEIGAVILGRWGLPDRTCAAVHFHHNPDACEPQYRPVAQLVHVSDFVCAAMGAPEPGELLPQQSSYGAWHDLKLDQQNLMELAREIESGISIGDIFVSVVL
jgi:HD-like signal output (HDOD) protein